MCESVSSDLRAGLHGVYTGCTRGVHGVWSTRGLHEIDIRSTSGRHPDITAVDLYLHIVKM